MYLSYLSDEIVAGNLKIAMRSLLYKRDQNSSEESYIHEKKPIYVKRSLLKIASRSLL